MKKSIVFCLTLCLVISGCFCAVPGNIKAEPSAEADTEMLFYGHATEQENGTVELTSASSNQRGSIWYGKYLMSESGFTTEFDYCAGEDCDDAFHGADGIVLTLSDHTGLGGDGEQLGFVEGEMSYGVEFDSFPYNMDDPEKKHVAIVRESTYHHLVSCPDERVNDNEWHTVQVTYVNASLDVYLDGELLLSYSDVTLSEKVCVGISAATGSGYNRQLVRNFTVLGEESGQIKKEEIDYSEDTPENAGVENASGEPTGEESDLGGYYEEDKAFYYGGFESDHFEGLVFYGNAAERSDGSIQLTPSNTDMRGSVWYKFPVLAEAGFMVEFEYWSGKEKEDGMSEGGDGIALNIAEETGIGRGGGGGSLGFLEGEKSYGVELDSYIGNENDPESKHIAIVQGTVANHLVYQLDERVDDRGWHSVRVNYADGSITVYLDDELIVSANGIDLPKQVYLGISAATGVCINTQLIKGFIYQGTLSAVDDADMENVSHEWEDEYTVDTEASCRNTGICSVHCKECNAVKNRIVIPATGHSFGEWESVSVPTCTTKGSKQRTCTVCGYTEYAEIEETEHEWETEYTIDLAPTCTASGSISVHCSNCDAMKNIVAIPETGHTWDEGIVTKQPTTSEEGEITYTCSACGVIATEPIEKLEEQSGIAGETENHASDATETNEGEKDAEASKNTYVEKEDSEEQADTNEDSSKTQEADGSVKAKSTNTEKKKRKSIRNLKFSTISVRAYNGKKHRPLFTIRNGNIKLL